MNGIGIGIGLNSGVLGGSLPQPDALFDTRTGLVLSDSIGGLQANIKSFPVCNFYNSAGGAFLTTMQSFEAPITNSGDYTAIIICKNENSDTVEARVNFSQINGNNKGANPFYVRSGALYNSTVIVTSTANLNNNASGKVVNKTEPWVLAYTYDVATTTPKVWLNGTEIDSVSDANWALGLASGTMSWGARATYTNVRILGTIVFDRKLTEAELLDITNNGAFPAITPSRLWLHNNYGDIVSDSLLSCHNRSIGAFTNNNSNVIIPDRDTMWNYRYDDKVFAYPLFYGYTSNGNWKLAYAPTGSKMSADKTGDIEHLSTGCIHNMYESRIDFSSITDAAVKDIFNKSNRTYWKSSIESEDAYIDAGGGYYNLWHPSQLNRTFIETHAQSGHENHIFPSIRTSGQAITGITAIRIFKTNVA